MAGRRGRQKVGVEVPGLRDLSPIGRGASGTVYRAYDEELKRWVAVKVLVGDDPEDAVLRRFQREREITANLGRHPHIVQVLGSGVTTSGQPYVVMELFEQGSVADRLRHSGPFSVAETLDVGEKIADAVEAAHRAGVLHRDIKPQNVLISEYGPALADFGIARATTSLEWSQGLDQLTPLHAAPEILQGGPPTVEADVYSLGSTLFTMLEGHPAFAGRPGESTFNYQWRVIEDPFPGLTRPDVPPALAAVIARAMAKDPAERFGSAGDLSKALRAVDASDLADHPVDAADARPRAPKDLDGEITGPTRNRVAALAAEPTVPPGPDTRAPSFEGASALLDHQGVLGPLAGLLAADHTGTTVARLRQLLGDQEPSAEPVHHRSWRQPKILVPGVAAVCAIAAVLSLILSGTFGGTSASLVSQRISGYQLGKLKFPDHVIVTSKWVPLTDHGDQVQGLATVINNSDSAVLQTFDEVIPKGLARAISDIAFDPQTQQPKFTVNADPIVRFCLSLAPRSHVPLGYSVNVSTLPTVKDYVAWKRQWTVTTNQDKRDPGGSPCPGKNVAPPTPTIAPGGGVIVQSGSGTTVVPDHLALSKNFIVTPATATPNGPATAGQGSSSGGPSNSGPSSGTSTGNPPTDNPPTDPPANNPPTGTKSPGALTLSNMTASVSGSTVTVQVDATPAIINVSLLNAKTGVKVASDMPPASGVATWTLTLAPGTYHLEAVGYDVPPGAAGQESNNTTVLVTVAGALTLSNMTASVSGSTVTVQVDATPAIINVSLLNAKTGVKVASDMPPASGVATWTLTLAPGTYHLEAVGYDVPPGAAGQESNNTTVLVTVAGALTLSNMTASVSGSTVTVQVDATPAIINVSLLNAKTGVKVASDMPPASGVATWTLTLAPGTYHLEAVGYDVPPGAAGQESNNTTVLVTVA